MSVCVQGLTSLLWSVTMLQWQNLVHQCTIQTDHDQLAKILSHMQHFFRHSGCAMGSRNQTINFLVGIITKLVLQRLDIIISDKLIESYEKAI